jgi:hypothetical protein
VQRGLVFLGDADLTSLAVHLMGVARRTTVIDIDRDVSYAAGSGAPSRILPMPQRGSHCLPAEPLSSSGPTGDCTSASARAVDPVSGGSRHRGSSRLLGSWSRR